MSRESDWAAVDRYFADRLLPSDAALEAALAASAAAGLPAHNVSPLQGQLLCLLARMQRARSIVEIGTLGGYSTIWLARALPPDGRLVTLEREPRCAEVARANFARAGLEHVIELRLGAALDTLPGLAAELSHAVDLVFIDADKRNNPAYFEWALRLGRGGAVIVVDNVVRAGAVADPASSDPDVQGVRRLTELIASDPRVEATAMQTVGSKGWDGFALALVS